MVSNWWNSRAPREKGLLLIAAALCVLTVLFMGGLQPLSDARAAAKLRLENAMQDNIQIDRTIAQLSRSDPSRVGPAENANTFRLETTRLAQQYGLPVTRLQNGPEGSLQLVFSDVSPTLIYSWLADMSQRPGGTVLSATLTQREDGVQAVIELEGAVR